MSEEEYPAASPEQKLNIAQYFIMSSPIGEVDEVVADVQKLVNDPAVLNTESLTNILREYNTEQMIAANDLSLKESRPILITKYNQVAVDLYLDPISGKVLKFDHLKRLFIEETDKKQVLSPSVDNHRIAINNALTSYLAESFRPNKCLHAVYGADNGLITIVIAAKNINLTNYWTGAWRGIYSINVLSGSTAELKGNVKTHVHYFEDGNVQLHSSTEYHNPINIDTSSPDITAKRIVEAINKFESEWQNQLEEMYVNMHRTTFKAMRRLLPINKQKFLWNSAAHSLAAEVNK